MAVRPRFADAAVIRPSQALSIAPIQEVPGSGVRQETTRSPARKGKKAIAFWVEPAASTQVRVAAVSMGRTVQAIMEEALDDWFVKHRLHRLTAPQDGSE